MFRRGNPCRRIPSALVASLIPNSVLPDSNVWFSLTLHSWFGLLAAETRGSWRFYWTEDIFAETVYRLRRERFPRASSKKMEDVRDRLMNSMGNNRISNFPHDSSVTYPDEFDAHVHSAAVHAGIAIIVTDDRKGFMGLYPDPDDCPYEVYRSDEFLMLAAQSAPEKMDAVILEQLNYHQRRGKPFSLPKKLAAAGCDDFAEHVRQRLQILAC